MKRFFFLIVGVLLTFPFFACNSDSNEFEISDWVGSWKSIGDPQPILKSSQGNIYIDESNSNGLIINGALFNMNSSVRIHANLTNENTTATFNYSELGLAIYGTGTMLSKNEVKFNYTLETDADKDSYSMTVTK